LFHLCSPPGGGDAEPAAQQAEHGLLHEWRHDGVAAVPGTIVSPYVRHPGGGDAEPAAQQAKHGLFHEWRHDGVAAVLGTIVSPLFTT